MRLLDRGAMLSPDKVYRYLLTRNWDRAQPTVCFVMLNPSTADAIEDDPTIRRCIGFAKEWRLGGLEVVNLYAYRSTDPKELTRVPDPVGPGNLTHIRLAARRSVFTIAAWGSSTPKGAEPHIERVCRLLDAHANLQLRCLGSTKNGSPRHPLYLSAHSTPLLWSRRGR